MVNSKGEHVGDGVCCNSVTNGVIRTESNGCALAPGVTDAGGWSTGLIIAVVLATAFICGACVYYSRQKHVVPEQTVERQSRRDEDISIHANVEGKANSADSPRSPAGPPAYTSKQPQRELTNGQPGQEAPPSYNEALSDSPPERANGTDADDTLPSYDEAVLPAPDGDAPPSYDQLMMDENSRVGSM